MIENAKKILLLDDHPTFSLGISVLLKSQGLNVLGQVATTAEAQTFLKRETCDLLVTDVSLKNEVSIDAIPGFRSQFPETAIMVLTMHEDPRMAARAFNSGALAYVSKGDAPQKILEAVQHALAGRHFVTPILRDHMQRGFFEAVKTEVTEDLSPRERQILRLLARGQSRKEIASNLELSHKTVDSYFAILKKKLTLSTTKELLKYAITQENK